MKSTAPRKYSPALWAEARTAFAAGIGLRELARQLGIPAGTMLARAKREGWTAGVAKARAIVPLQSNAITPAEAAARAVSELGTKSRVALAKGLHRGAEHVARMPGGAVLESATNVASLARAGSAVFSWVDEARPPLVRLELIAACAAKVVDAEWEACKIEDEPR